MKRKFFYLFSVVWLGVSLSSCLDLADARESASDEFAVIRHIDDVSAPVAFVGMRGLIMTWDGISEYSVGDAMILGYDVNLSNQSDGIIVADPAKINVTTEFPSASQKSIHIGPVDTLVQDPNNMLETLSLRTYSKDKFFSDRWLFFTRAKIKDGQTIDLEFYYDTREGMQHTSTGSPLPDNVVVMDVKLNIKGEGDGVATSQEKYVVVNFSNFRSEIFKDATESTQCQIWFRYYDKTKSETKPSYVQNMGGLIHEVFK